MLARPAPRRLAEGCSTPHACSPQRCRGQRPPPLRLLRLAAGGGSVSRACTSMPLCLSDIGMQRKIISSLHCFRRRWQGPSCPAGASPSQRSPAGRSCPGGNLRGWRATWISSAGAGNRTPGSVPALPRCWRRWRSWQRPHESFSQLVLCSIGSEPVEVRAHSRLLWSSFRPSQAGAGWCAHFMGGRELGNSSSVHACRVTP